MTPLTIGSLTPGQQTPDVTAATDAQRKAARDFEAIFLRQLLSSLEKGGGVGAQSSGGNVFRSMMVSALADTAAEGGGIGLSEVILKAMLPPTPPGAAAPGPVNAAANPAAAEAAPQAETQTSPARSSRLGAASQVLTEATRRLMFAGARGESILETLEAPLYGAAPLSSEPPPGTPRANESTDPAFGGASTARAGAGGSLSKGNVR
jgi:Rod binding domain-containing protein